MDERAPNAYRDDVAAAYARIESLEAETRTLRETAADLDAIELEDRIRRLEAHGRRWDRMRTTLAILLGFSVIVAMNVGDRFGSSAGLLVACVAMVAIGITVAWPSLSVERTIGRRGSRTPHTKSSDAGGALRSGVRVTVSDGAAGDGLAKDEARSGAARSELEAPRSSDAPPEPAPERAC